MLQSITYKNPDVVESIQLFPQRETDAYIPDPENQPAAQGAGYGYWPIANINEKCYLR